MSSTKLTPGVIQRARQMLSRGLSTQEVAAQLHVRRASIAAILANMTRNGEVSSTASSSTSRVRRSTTPSVWHELPHLGLAVKAPNAAAARDLVQSMIVDTDDVVLLPDANLATRRISQKQVAAAELDS